MIEWKRIKGGSAKYLELSQNLGWIILGSFVWQTRVILGLSDHIVVRVCYSRCRWSTTAVTPPSAWQISTLRSFYSFSVTNLINLHHNHLRSKSYESSIILSFPYFISIQSSDRKASPKPNYRLTLDDEQRQRRYYSRFAKESSSLYAEKTNQS